MAVKIRLARRGRKKMAMYDVIVADAKSPRDGRIIEKLGYYNPLTNPPTIVLKEDSALEWLLKGAQPTDTARKILSIKGVMLKKHLQVGVLKGAITQEQADQKFEDWLQGKEAEIAGNADSVAKKKADEAKARFEAEKKINEAKAEALKKKLAALVPVEEVEEAPEAQAVEAAEEKVAETPATEEKPVEEKEQTPKEEPKAEEVKVEEKAEVKVDEAKAETTEESVAEKVETPTEEKKEEVKVEEAKAETTKEPVAEKEEVPTEEKKEGTPAEEKKEEEKK